MAKGRDGDFEAHLLTCHACRERDLKLREYLKHELTDDAGLFASVHPKHH